MSLNTIDKEEKEPHDSEDFPNAFIIRREVFSRIGLFNSTLFPIHYDEADFCQRVIKAGYKIMVVPSARVWHDIPPPERDKIYSLHIKPLLEHIMLL